MSERSKEIKDDLPLSIREYPDVEKLIEYVEELEGQLKTKLSQWSQVCQKKDEFELRSYRYKQALEHIITRKMSTYLSTSAMNQDFIKVARQALEGEK